jgi:hypothetical protein
MQPEFSRKGGLLGVASSIQANLARARAFRSILIRIFPRVLSPTRLVHNPKRPGGPPILRAQEATRAKPHEGTPAGRPARSKPTRRGHARFGIFLGLEALGKGRRVLRAWQRRNPEFALGNDPDQSVKKGFRRNSGEFYRFSGGKPPWAGLQRPKRGLEALGKGRRVLRAWQRRSPELALGNDPGQTV